MADKADDIAGVVSWKTTVDDRVEINVKPVPPKDVVVNIDMNKGSELNIRKTSETNLEIVISKQQQAAAAASSLAAQGGQVSNMQSTDQNAPKKATGGDPNENPLRKQSENVLGNVMNLWKDYKGVIITAVIAISLGFLLRRKFKAV